MKQLKSIALAAALTVSSVFVVAPKAVAQEITFSLDFITLGRHAPWYTALGKGFYEEEGLDVTIIPAKGTAHAIQQVESGIAQLGFIDVPSLTIARSRGSTIKMVAVNYQKAPYSVFSMNPGANVTQPSDMEGLTIGSSTGSFMPNIYRAFMSLHGLDPSKLEIANSEPSTRIPLLMQGQVPAIDFFVMSKAGLRKAAEAAGKELSVMLLADFGLELYSNGIGATSSYIEENPETVRKFVRASLRGWQYALNNPEEAAKLRLQYAKALNPDITVAEIEILKTLAITENTKANGYGHMSVELMTASRDFIVENAEIDAGDIPAVDDMFDASFLPSDPVLP